MTPAQLDSVLPRLQVLARSSPEDKYLLVTRLNGTALPTTQEEWEKQHVGRDYEKEKDLLLPGYRSEWEEAREGAIGEVVGATGVTPSPFFTHTTIYNAVLCISSYIQKVI